MSKLVAWLLLPPAILACLFSLSVAGVLLSSLPPLVVVVAIALAVVVGVWFFFVRRRGAVSAGSESSLMGRQSSKEGLL